MKQKEPPSPKQKSPQDVIKKKLLENKIVKRGLQQFTKDGATGGGNNLEETTSVVSLKFTTPDAAENKIIAGCPAQMATQSFLQHNPIFSIPSTT